MNRLVSMVVLLGALGCTSELIPRVAHPDPATTDADEDGVMDDTDGCRDEAEDRVGAEDADGCPEPGPTAVDVQRTTKVSRLSS